MTLDDDSQWMTLDGWFSTDHSQQTTLGDDAKLLSLWYLGLGHPLPAAPAASASCHQCWLCRALRRIVTDKKCPRTGVAEEGCAFGRWELGTNVSGSKKKCQWPEGWRWLARTAANERFEYSHLEDLPHSGFSSSISFAVSIEVAIERAFGPTEPDENQAFRIHEPTEFVMIGEHEDLMLAAL